MNYVITICNPKSLELLTEICSGLELAMTTVLHGRGTAVKSMLDILGIESSEKRILFTVADGAKTQKLIELAKERLYIGVPGHGMIVSVPIKSVGGGLTMAYLNGGDENAKYTPNINYSYELIVAVTNEGMTDTVMNAARSVGAAGGTVLHGKGTGDSGDERFLNVSIAKEKEIVLIVAKADKKADIMRAVIEKAGPSTEAGTIVFSLPVSDIAGFGFGK